MLREFATAMAVLAVGAVGGALVGVAVIDSFELPISGVRTTVVGLFALAGLVTTGGIVATAARN